MKTKPGRIKPSRSPVRRGNSKAILSCSLTSMSVGVRPNCSRFFARPPISCAPRDCLNGPNPSYSLASRNLRSAIEALRDWGGKPERAEELEKLLIDYQAKSRSEMKRVAVSIDVSDFSEQERDRVKGKTLHEAITILSLLGSSPKVNDLRKQVEDAVRDAPLQHILAVELMKDMGKTIGGRASMSSEDPAIVESAIRAEMFSSTTVTVTEIKRTKRTQLRREARPAGYVSTALLCTSADSGWRPWTRVRNAQAVLARRNLCA